MQPLKVTTNLSNGKTLVMLDASALKESSCLLRLFYNTVQGYTSLIQNNDVEFGVAVHIFRKIVREKGEVGFGEGIKAATKYFAEKPMRVKSNKVYLTNAFLVDTCSRYFAEYEQDNLKPEWTGPERTGECLLELPFCFPYYIDDEVEIMMAGTIDEIGKITNGITCIVDLKTTSVYDQEGYFRGYDLSPQLIFYRWALGKYAEEFPDSFLSKYVQAEIGCMIDGIFLTGAKNPAKFVRGPVNVINQEKLREFDRMVTMKVYELISAILTYRQCGSIPPRYGMLNGACQTIYGPCKYFNVCAAEDQEVRDVLLSRDFIQKPYNPLTFHL